MQVKKNALVSILMTLSDEDGNIIDDNEEEIIYLHGGYGHLFAKLEDALEGKTIGDSFSVKLGASEGFGEFKEDLVSKELLSDLPEDVEIGMELDGHIDGVIFQVIDIDNTHAIVDGNHPYAGINLLANGKILEIEYLNDEAIAKILEDEHHH